MQRSPPVELKLEGLEMQKWNMLMGKDRRIDEINAVICLVIIFSPGVKVIKMSKLAHLFVFFADNSRKLVKV